jgi:hypothetical protein
VSNDSSNYVAPIRPSLGVWLVWVYAFWLITTPYRSPRLEFLIALRFERILASALVLYALMNLGARWRDPKPIILVACFFGVSLVSSLLSPVHGSENAQHWIDNYWKLWLLFNLILLCLRTKEDVYLVMLGISAISLGYQLLSWRDFLAGGSYVHQQGIKRMVGVWSGGGLGAANGFAFASLFTLPFCYAWVLRERGSGGRAFMLGGTAITVASMVFSGTRGAILVGLAVVFGGVLLFSAKRFRYLTLACMAAVGAYLAAPEEIRHRYTSQLLPFASGKDHEEKADEVASKSAEGRIEGLVDGYLLFLKRPLLGWGPGTSATARMGLDKAGALETELQLHSLYGQMFAETGLCGAALFAWLNWHLIISLVRTVRRSTEMSHGLAAILLTAFAITLLYGFVNHSLYEHYWILLFGLSTVLISEQRYDRADDDFVADDSAIIGPDVA